MPSLSLEKTYAPPPSSSMVYPRLRPGRRNSCGNARSVLWLALADTLPEDGAADEICDDLHLFTIRNITDRNFPALKANQQVEVQPDTVDSGRQIDGVPAPRLLWTLGLQAAASGLAPGAAEHGHGDGPGHGHGHGERGDHCAQSRRTRLDQPGPARSAPAAMPRTRARWRSAGSARVLPRSGGGIPGDDSLYGWRGHLRH